MEDRGEFAVAVGIAGDSLQKFACGHVILELQREQVFPLLVLTEKIGDDNLLEPPAVEFVHQRAPDEPAGSGDQNAGFFVEKRLAGRGRFGRHGPHPFNSACCKWRGFHLA